MVIGIVGPMTSCMKGQGIYTKFKAKYNKKEKLRSIILQEEETSTLTMDSEEEDEEEVWVEVEAKSFVITAHSQEIWQVLALDQVLRDPWSSLTILDFDSPSKAERKTKHRLRDLSPFLGFGNM
jgi:hypothetical protein